jgi:hypothetical protein
VDFTRLETSISVCALLEINVERITLGVQFLRGEHKSAHKKKERHKNSGITF